MPTYEAICPKCSKEQTYKQPIDKRDDTPVCCGQNMQRKLAAPMGYVDIPAA